ncbi:MAG: pantoate--beta-alanine ligase [Nocardioidaceae bacterium]|nr:pantoate--beta-alanine ligase [Nocardioidaceae bacterium]
MVTTHSELRETLAEADRSRAARVALVPTMGALHRGHASLLDEARRMADLVVASIFVNPLQFGAGEDLARYPRSLEADLAMCQQHGVSVVFAPSVDVVYPAWPPVVTVDPGPTGSILEGASRPEHFRGVLTVVAKLFGLVTPNVAIFGEKDYQQLVLVRQLATDLCMPVEVVGAETVRGLDGLALSSRNRYLSDSERACALALSRALAAGAAAGSGGATGVLAAAEAVLGSEPGVAVDYLTLRGTDFGEPPNAGEARLLVAAKVGGTRLIDNLAVQLS